MLRALGEVAEDAHFMNNTQKCSFRHEDLRHMRIEQFRRHFSLTGDKGEERTFAALENTAEHEHLLNGNCTTGSTARLQRTQHLAVCSRALGKTSGVFATKMYAPRCQARSFT